MSVVANALLALLLSLPRYKADTETLEERTQRLTVVSVAIERATERATCSGEYATEGCTKVWFGSPKALRMSLVTVANFESAFAQHIHEGNCTKYECDRGKAHSLWQLHVSSNLPREDWEKIHAPTQEATDLAAWYAAKKLASCSYRGVAGMFSLYMTGSTVSAPGGKKRAEFFKLLMQRP